MSDNWGIGFFQRLEDQKLEKKMNDKIEEMEQIITKVDINLTQTLKTVDWLRSQLQELKKQEHEVQKDWPQVGDTYWTYDSLGYCFAVTFTELSTDSDRKKKHRKQSTP